MIRLVLSLPRDQIQKLSLDVRMWAQPSVRHRLLNAIGRRFLAIALNNMGPGPGEARPAIWAALEKRYAAQVAKRPFRNQPVPTLLRSGALRRSLTASVSGQYAIIEGDSPYAAAHQFGNPARNLPARPYFPMNHDGTVLTPYAHKELVEAALKELKTVT